MSEDAAHDPETRRALQLDALAAILPMDRRDQLAKLLSDDDDATHKHLAKEGMGANSLRALASDLGYLEAWALAATGAALPWPAPEGLALKFVAHHLWDPGEARSRCSPQVASATRDGARRRRRVARRLSACARDRSAAPLQLEHAAPLARAPRPVCLPRPSRGPAPRRARQRKSRRAVTRDVLDKLLAICATDRLAECRERALLLFAFASGGRRRSEIAGLRVKQISDGPPVSAAPRRQPPMTILAPCWWVRRSRR